MNWRRLTIDDLSAGLAICPDCVGAELVGFDRAVAAWRQLTNMPSFGGAIVEDAAGRVVGIGAAVFVSAAFATGEIAYPQPGLNARIIKSVDSGRSVVLSQEQLQAGNAFGGLDLVVLCAARSKEMVDASALSEVESTIGIAFFRLFLGWRFRQMMREGVGRDTLAHIESQRVFGTRDNFEAFRQRNPDAPWSHDRALFVCTKEFALAFPGSVAAILFGYREPILRLTRHDQHLLDAALAGATDDELARQLKLKTPTVKKRWATVFHHVSEVKPDIFPSHVTLSDSRSRGPQKRHLLLDYLRQHPEELRPTVSGRRRLPLARSV